VHNRAGLNPAKVRQGCEKEFTAFQSQLDHFQTPPIQKITNSPPTRSSLNVSIKPTEPLSRMPLQPWQDGKMLISQYG